MMALGLGVSQLIVAYEQQRAHLIAAVPLRMIAMIVFASDGREYWGVAAWEFTLGMAIAGGLWREWRMQREAEDEKMS